MVQLIDESNKNIYIAFKYRFYARSTLKLCVLKKPTKIIGEKIAQKPIKVFFSPAWWSIIL